MLPPVDSLVLERNPRFKAFYIELMASKLSEDGTTKDQKKDRAHANLGKNMTKVRTELAKRSVIVESLKTIAWNRTELPSELREVVVLICAQLSGCLSIEDSEILQEDVSCFVDHIENISEALSTQLQTVILQLGRIVNPLDGPSALRSLPSSITTLNDDISRKIIALTKARQALTARAIQVLSINRTVVETTIRILERAQHGSVTRHARARAEYLAAVAKGMELKLSIANNHLSIQPSLPAELFDALKNYSTNLLEEKRKLVSRQTSARRALEGYDNKAETDGKEMRELAERFAVLKDEETRLEEELQRLG